MTIPNEHIELFNTCLGVISIVTREEVDIGKPHQEATKMLFDNHKSGKNYHDAILCTLEKVTSNGIALDETKKIVDAFFEKNPNLAV